MVYRRSKSCKVSSDRRRADDPRQGSLWDWSAKSAAKAVASERPLELEASYPASVGGAVSGRPAKTAPNPEGRPSAVARRDRGRVGYLAGASAELRVAQDYERRGFPLDRRRWRGKAGEIDLIVRDGDGLVFVEVKKRRSFERAAERLTSRQMARLQTAAEEYLGTQPKGSLTDVRFDVALVNGHGEMRVIENAFGGW